MGKFDFDESIEEIIFDHKNFNYHYGTNGFLFASGKHCGTLYVFIDSEWQDVQDVEFDWGATQEEFEVDSSDFFLDDS